MKIGQEAGLGLVALFAAVTAASLPAIAQQQQKKPNIVMLMTDDTGWGDFGYMSGGGKALGHPTPNIDRTQRRRGVHELVWPGELHRGSRLFRLDGFRSELPLGVVAPRIRRAEEKLRRSPSSSRRTAIQPIFREMASWRQA